MSLNELTEAVRERMGDGGLSGSLKFDLGEVGVIRVDGTAIDNADVDVDCTIRVSEEDFRGIMEGSQDPQAAFMMGKLKVEGDLGVAMQLATAI